MITDRGYKAIEGRKDKPTSVLRSLVKWFSLEKGYGFITSDNGQEYFVHHSGITDPIRYLREGEFVEFQGKRTERGMQAVHVRSLGKKMTAS